MILENIILGIIQGIAEWIPISSEGLLVLVKSAFFSSGSLVELVRLALFLHLGTFLAALIYFRKDVGRLFKTLFKPKGKKIEDKKTLKFLIISTIITGIIGILLLKTVLELTSVMDVGVKVITFGIGALLLITAFLQIKSKSGFKTSKQIKIKDSILLGVMQGFAALPGLSRSGLTVSTLLLRKFDKTTALKLSFLMSLPVVLFGNLILNLSDFAFNSNYLLALLFSFVFGFLTIHYLIKLSKKVNFGYFVLIFAILTIIAGFLLI